MYSKMTPVQLEKVETLFNDVQKNVFKNTDKLFILLLYLQWLGAILCALIISPKAWEGHSNYVHIHVWAAFILGFAINLAPTLLYMFDSGSALTRHVITFAQFCWSAFLIHLSGGRIETHFHVFGSLAFLSFYRDWKLYITATIVVATDHILRSSYWPESAFGVGYQTVYGSLSSANWRWLEHALWVIFCDIFLVFSCFRGIAELRELCRRQVSLESAIQAKSLFLANVSHELRTPMHGILNFADLGQQKAGAAPVEKMKTYFNEIYKSGSRLLTLLNDLLDLSKLEANKVVYSKQDTDLIKTAQLIRDELGASLETKNLTLKLENNQPQIQGNFDPEKLMQVIRNLVSNAVKFSEEASEIRVVVEEKGDGIVCKVINKGVGIPPEELETIFDKFIQSSRTRTGAGGTGLGLAICKEIIEQHNGKIWAESVEGGETCFTFELPKRN